MVKPICHFPEHVLDRLSSLVALGLISELNVCYDRTVSLEGQVHSLALDGEGTGVIVSHTVNEQNGVADLVSGGERRDLDVHLRRLPECPALALEAKRSERSVVGSASCHS